MDNKDNIPVIFGPKNGKVIKSMYPELASNKAFKDITNEELTFVWYFACESSPIDDGMAPEFRAMSAAAKAFGDDAAKKAKFGAMEFTERVKEAIDQMRKYKPEARAMAQRIIQVSFSNLYAMAKVNQDDFIEEEDDGKGGTVKKINFSARKQYVETVSKISETVPELLKQLEHNFGVEVKEGDVAGTRTIDKYHTLKKEDN